MLKRSVTQTKTWTWAASSSVQEILPRDGYITHIDFMVEITPSATLAAANQFDAVWRCIENFTIQGGQQCYFTLPAEQGGRLWHFMNRKHFRGCNVAGQLITNPNVTYHPVMFRYHPGSRPLLPDGSVNYFDLSAFIPAIEEPSLTATWLTTANTCLDDTVTLSSATMKATVHMVQGTPEEIKAEMAYQGVVAKMTPAALAELFPTTGTKPAYSEERSIPTGGYLRGIGMLVQDATATRPLRASDEITAIAITMPGIGSQLIAIDTEALYTQNDFGMFEVADDAVMLGGVHAPVAAFYLPLKDRDVPVRLPDGTLKFNPLSKDYGLNLLTAQTGEWKLGMTVATYAAGDDVLIWYDRLIPYVGSALR